MKMKRILAGFGVSFLAVVWSSSASAQAPVQGPVKVAPPAAVRDMASAPKPPSSAQQAKSVGKGKATANTANSVSDTDSLWIERIDVDGDGNVDEASLLWDDEDKVLYLYKEGTFTCKNGGTGEGGMLVAVYGAGNTRKAPAGSGWWAVELDKSECASQVAGLYGCKFDTSGNATACGMAAVDDKNDDLVIVAVSK
jgi:hypothetical protein